MSESPKTLEITQNLLVVTAHDRYRCTMQKGDGEFVGTPQSSFTNGAYDFPSIIQIHGAHDIVMRQDSITIRLDRPQLVRSKQETKNEALSKLER